jgi:hypothetical protein
LFFVVPDPGGEGVKGGAEGADLVGQAGEGAAGCGAAAVIVDDGAQGRVAVQGVRPSPVRAATAVKVTGWPSRRSWAQARSTWLRVLVPVIRLGPPVRAPGRGGIRQ